MILYILSYILLGLTYLVQIYSWILVIYALLSWVPALRQSWVGYFIGRLSRPFLSLFDKIPTQIGIFDFQIVLAVIALQFVLQFLYIVLRAL